MAKIYKKMASSWDKKRGSRDCHSNVFNGTTQNEPLYHVASMLEGVFCYVHVQTGIATVLACVEPEHTMTSSNARGVWIYDMRPSDAAPRTQQDEVRLNRFVSSFIHKHFVGAAQRYLLDHIAISMCFFAWFFTAPDYFYATKEMRQTTRRGIEKIWTETLLRKQPKTMTMPPTTKMSKSRGDMHQSTLLAKMEDEKRALQTKIETVVNCEYPSHIIDWSDERLVHLNVSECFDMNGVCYISGKKSKKLNSLYQDYQKIVVKVTRTKAGITRAENEQRSVNLVSSCKQTQEPVTVAEPMEPEDEVPESWEDLMV